MLIQDAIRQINYLQQCLSTDKKHLGFFLGAGCPMAMRVGADGELPLIPDNRPFLVLFGSIPSVPQACGDEPDPMIPPRTSTSFGPKAIRKELHR